MSLSLGGWSDKHRMQELVRQVSMKEGSQGARCHRPPYCQPRDLGPRSCADVGLRVSWCPFSLFGVSLWHASCRDFPDCRELVNIQYAAASAHAESARVCGSQGSHGLGASRTGCQWHRERVADTASQHGNPKTESTAAIQRRPLLYQALCWSLACITDCWKCTHQRHRPPLAAPC